MRVTRRVAIGKIVVEGQSVRAAVDDDHVAELALSIARHGLLQPVVVREDGDGGYRLEAGFHRLAACVRLGWDHIPSYVARESDAPVRAIAATENLCRRDMSLWEQIVAVNHLHHDEQLSVGQLTDLLSRSRSWVERRLAAPQLPDRLRDAIFDGEIGIGAAEEIARVDDEPTRNLILNQAVIGKLTVKQVRELATAYLEGGGLSGGIEAGVQAAGKVAGTEAPVHRCEACGELMPIGALRAALVCASGCEGGGRSGDDGTGE